MQRVYIDGLTTGNHKGSLQLKKGFQNLIPLNQVHAVPSNTHPERKK